MNPLRDFHLVLTLNTAATGLAASKETVKLFAQLLLHGIMAECFTANYRQNILHKKDTIRQETCHEPRSSSKSNKFNMAKLSGRFLRLKNLSGHHKGPKKQSGK